MFNVFAMDEFDREIAVAEKAYEIEMAEASFMETMIDTKLQINLAKSEYKIMTEGCQETANGDLLYLFNEAAKEAEGAKEGVLTKVKNALINFFTSTWNSLQKIFTGKNTEAYNKLKASKEPVTLPFSQKVVDAADKVVTKCEEASKNPALKILGPVAGILGVALSGKEAKLMFDEYKKKGNTPWQTFKGQACIVLEKLCSLFERVKNLLPKTNENSENADETFNVIKGVKEFLMGLINKVKSILGVGSDVNDTDEKNGEQPASENSGATA